MSTTRLICLSPQGTCGGALISSNLTRPALTTGVNSKKRRKPAKGGDDDRTLVWAAIEQADINAQRNYATGKSWLCQKWVGLRVKFEDDPGGGPNGEDLPELSGEITGFE